MPPRTRSAAREEEVPAPINASVPKKAASPKKTTAPKKPAAPKKSIITEKVISPKNTAGRKTITTEDKPIVTKRTGKGTIPKGSSRPGSKGKGAVAAGVRKSAPVPRGKKPTTEGAIAAAGTIMPVPFPHAPITYLELQPPDLTPNEDGDIPNNGYVGRHCKKAKKDYNGSEVKISEGAYKRLVKMYVECEKRDPESNGYVHIFEDFRGYGIIEVIGAQVADYVKEQKKASQNLFKSFEIIEALAFFFDGTYDYAWSNVDDGEGVESLVELIGIMIVNCFHKMETSKHPLAPLLSKPSLTPLKNVELVMGLCLGFGSLLRSLTCDPPARWEKEIWRIAERRGLELRDTKGPMEKEPEMDEEDEDEYLSDDEEKGEKDWFNFSSKLAEYIPRGFRLGGTHYDLSKAHGWNMDLY